MNYNKKASLEMSIQAIVIVVLAMTLLGLGLGFIKGMFRNISSTTEDVSEQVRQKVLDDLVQGDKKISFPKTEVVVNKGESTVLTVGIKNKMDATLKYMLRFNTLKCPTTVTDPTQCDTIRAEFNKNFLFDKKKLYSLAAADSTVRNIKLTVPSITSGSYFVRFDVVEPPLDPNTGNPQSTPTGEPPVNSPVYASKDFFVVVRG